MMLLLLVLLPPSAVGNINNLNGVVSSRSNIPSEMNVGKGTLAEETTDFIIAGHLMLLLLLLSILSLVHCYLFGTYLAVSGGVGHCYEVQEVCVGCWSLLELLLLLLASVSFFDFHVD